MTTPSPQQESPWKLYATIFPTQEDANEHGYVVRRCLDGALVDAPWDSHFNDGHWTRHSDLPPLPVVPEMTQDIRDEEIARDVLKRVGGNYAPAFASVRLVTAAVKEGRAEGAREAMKEAHTKVCDWIDAHLNEKNVGYKELRAIVAGKGEAS